ncbi:MAG: GNAT family N-acetyltransferase [Melioribacteraceae bacterium]|nr:GNAT family N-acetyltransferase [Melioribacteraceae bacterium]MCF8354729.1 GNAT family N-acetyltransferase [Melioribacteraceae bacterium]MCF8394358.1 GNAT family N-acetyltransferase [Melioribacteraceae bacterium]MCF8420068.1 GNAT family N-acetyltransferase [Melioribacteraceae bacterium]
MLEIRKIEKLDELTNPNKSELVDFLHTHLDRFGDSKEAIEKCIDYSFSDEPGKGGFVLVEHLDNKLVGALVINDTGMGGYIPEHVLVYVAVDATYRNKGLGRKIVEKAIEHCDGNVKLHVEYDNPAKRLYERLGFTNKYAEMRYTQDNK